jgi:hypothetical protein
MFYQRSLLPIIMVACTILLLMFISLNIVKSVNTIYKLSLGQYDKKQSYTDIFRIGLIPVRPITARSESARRFDNRKENSREMSVVCWRFLFKFSSKKNTSCFICYHTKPFVWYDIFFLIVGILIQVCGHISGQSGKFSRSSSTYS